MRKLLLSIFLLSLMVLPAQAGLQFLTPVKGVSFTPASLPGLRLWLRGDSFTFSTTATWTDLSGNGFNYTNTGSNRPTAGTGINGKPGVVFDGTDDFLSYTTTSIVNKSAPVFLAIVFKLASYGNITEGAQMLLQMYDSNGSPDPLNIFLTNQAGILAAFYKEFSFAFGAGGLAASRGANPSAAFTTASAMTGNYNGGSINTNGAYGFWQNNSSLTVVSGSGWAGNNANRIGTWSGGGYYYNGEIAEIILLNQNPTSQNQTDLESYFSSMYGI